MVDAGTALQPVTRRRWGAALAGGGAVALLSACAGPFGAPAPAAPPGGAAGGPGAAGAGDQALEIAIPWAEPEPVNAGLRQAVDAFVAGHPQSPVRLSVISPWGPERLATSVAAGAPPALTLLPPTAVTTWGPQGLIQPLEDRFKAAKLNGSEFFPPVWETMSWGGNGKVWHLPVQVDPNFPFFWNKAALRDAGLDPEAPPATVDALDQMAERLARESGGQWERLGFVPWNWYGAANSFTTAAYMFGGSFFDRARDRVTFNDPQVIRAAQWIAGWAQRLGMERVAQPFGGTNPARLLASGKLAFHPLVSVDIPLARQENPALQLGSGALPAAAPGQSGAVWTGGWHAALVAGSKRPDEAWELLRWIGASDEGTLAVARKLGGLPGFARSPGLDELSGDANMKAYVDAVRRAKFLPPDFYLPVAVDYTPFVDAIAGRRAVPSALDEMTGQTQRQLDERRAQPPAGQAGR
jgi:multiple sugar transport system substrate-binding protein